VAGRAFKLHIFWGYEVRGPVPSVNKAHASPCPRADSTFGVRAAVAPRRHAC
jgi:hypothetical protein